MPGLFGIVGTGSCHIRKQELHQMLCSVYKGSSMVSGSYNCDEQHVYAGWTCQKGAYSDCMPIVDSGNQAVMFFAGEHYAPGEGLQLHGRYIPNNKATALLDLYLDQGESFIANLNGFFHGLIIDRVRNKVFLFNDRFGMQRIYYVEESGAILFSSEAKALLAIRPSLRSFDNKGICEWISCGAVLENRSLFEGVRVLPAASIWSISLDSGTVKRTYFTPEVWENQDKLDITAYFPKLQETSKKILPR